VVPAQIRMTSKELVQRIQTACAKLAREVKVESDKDHKVVVHVYAIPKADQSLLVARLMQMPELSASNVSVHIHMPK
jgi:hypothetical protein